MSRLKFEHHTLVAAEAKTFAAYSHDLFGMWLLADRECFGNIDMMSVKKI